MPDIVLVGCVKTKRSGKHPAQDLYISPLFRQRRHYVKLKRPHRWFILSAKHGLLEPIEEIEPYDCYLADLPYEERLEWSRNVLTQLTGLVDSLHNTAIEIHAGKPYWNCGLKSGLEQAGAIVTTPLDGLKFGDQVQWYDAQQKTDVGEIVRQLTQEFMEESWDINERRKKFSNTPTPGWNAMPECVAVAKLQKAGASGQTIRRFVTLVAAMDRARNADLLWQNATQLFFDSQWVFEPESVARRSPDELKKTLSGSNVSQRHEADTTAWNRLLQAMVAPESPRAFRQAIDAGNGDANELLEVLNKYPKWFPFLKGPKISVVWVRMLVDPGGANIDSLEILRVAVDVQVRKVTEYLGVTDTAGRGGINECLRRTIQATWQEGAKFASGPGTLSGTAGALDPPLWFFGKWGCTFCEKAKKRVPISALCERCQYAPA